MPPLGEVVYNGSSRLNLFGEERGCSSFRSTVSRGHSSRKDEALSVTFCETVEIEETLHLDNFSEEEHSAYWMTGEEYNQIIDMADIQVELMQQGEPEDPDCFLYYRGLESRCTLANDAYEEMYFELVYALLYEQECQRDQGFYDSERIASLCSQFTQESQLLAREVADKDAIEARLEYQLR